MGAHDPATHLAKRDVPHSARPPSAAHLSASMRSSDQCRGRTSRQVRNLAVRASPDVGEQRVQLRASLPFSEKHTRRTSRFPPVTQPDVTSGYLTSPSVGKADSKTAIFVWIAHEQAPSVLAAVESARPD
jgi:hypothetical protein